jgi:hypothetical protein
MISFFIVLQFVLLIFMLFHDWISFPPLNDVLALKKVDGNKGRLIASVINGGFVLIPLLLTVIYACTKIPLWASLIIFLFYLGLTVGTILSWWVPYFFGSSQKHKEQFAKFNNTHHFLPARGNNVVPNTLHVLLHLQVWGCFIVSIFLLAQST